MEKDYRPCIAFKMNYCDGGKNSERIGFYGICSDKMINFNIKTKKREWCSNDKCACRRCFDKKISRAELEENWDENDVDLYTCYESAALRDYFFEAGVNSDGVPRSIRGAKTGHLCILTTVEPNMRESERIVVAMFLIGRIFEGDDEESGFVGANENFGYCLEFKPHEARKMKFWDIYQNPNAPNVIKWGSGLFRYFTDVEAVEFLKKAVEVKQAVSEKNFAQEFLQHYRELNKV